MKYILTILLSFIFLASQAQTTDTITVKVHGSIGGISESKVAQMISDSLATMDLSGYTKAQVDSIATVIRSEITSGGVTQAQLDDSTTAIRNDFPASGVNQAQLDDTATAIRGAIPDTSNLVKKNTYFPINVIAPLYPVDSFTIGAKVSNDPNSAGDSSKLITDWAAKNITDGTFISITRFGAKGADLLSDRAAIQATVDSASIHGGTVLIPKGDWYLDSTIVLPSNTTILCQEGAVIHLMDSVNTEMLSNLHKTTQANLTILDSNINIIGGTWMANGDNQTKYKPDVTPVSGFLFSGIKNCKFYDVTLYNSQTYAYNICNFKDLIFDKCNINQGDTLPTVAHNQDGFHLNGPGYNLQIVNSKLRTYDDAIAINADDNTGVGTYQSTGDITNVLINNILFDSTRKGIRLLSSKNKIDNVVISNITGVTYDHFLEASKFRNLPGRGNFGSIAVSNVNINTIASPSSKTWPTYANRFIYVYGNFNSLSFNNITRIGSIMFNDPLAATIIVDTPSVIKNFTINGLISYRQDTFSMKDILFTNGDTIQNLSINNHRLFAAGDTTKNTGIYIAGLTANSVSITNSNYDTLNTAINIVNSKINSFILNNNNALRISKSIPIASSVIDTVFISGNYFRGSTRKAFSTTSSGNTITKLRAFIPVMATPGSDAIADSIEYSYNGSNYSIKSPASIGGSYLPLSGGAMTGSIGMVNGNQSTPNFYITGSPNYGLYFGTSYFGYTLSGVSKFFFQAATNRGLVLANDMPVSWAATSGANLSAPDIFFTRKSAGVLQLSNDASTGAAALILNGLSTGYVSKATNYTATAFDYTIDITATGVTITLPTAVGASGRNYLIKLTASGSGTVATTSSQTIDGATTYSLSAQYKYVRVQSNGANWLITGNN